MKVFQDGVSGFDWFTYFIAGTLAIGLVVAIWTVFGAIADRQHEDACPRSATVLIVRACCLYVNTHVTYLH